VFANIQPHCRCDAPVITCPGPTTVSCASEVPAANTASVTLTDGCGGALTKTHVGDVVSNQTCANRYIITRTYRGSDACGNTATCSQTITVNDQTPPTLNCPATVNLNCNPTSWPAGTATATDNCTGTVTVTSVLNNDESGAGCSKTRTRTYTATDVCGNTATCTQTYTYTIDTQGPSITVAASSAIPCNPTSEQVATAFGTATITDLCDGNPTIVTSIDSTHTGCNYQATKHWWLRMLVETPVRVRRW
jgi:hypothetical protein